MTAIADPIRTLSGATGTLTLDAMAEKLTAANGDVTSILTALTDKGVDTTGAGLSDIAALVAGIESGGGGLFTIKQGTYIPASDVTESLSIADIIGETPDDAKKWFFIMLTYDASQTGIRLITMLSVVRTAKYSNEYSAGYYGLYATSNSSSSHRSNCEYTTDGKVTLPGANSGIDPYYLRANHNYAWFYGVIE